MISNIPKIRVIVRKRPINQKELQKKETDIITIVPPSKLILNEIKVKLDLDQYTQSHEFNFDATYGESATNEQIYIENLRPLINFAFLSKGKVSCFAYGQTGSGKTFTMLGDGLNTPGMYLFASYDIFNTITTNFPNLMVSISIYEIYCGKLFDLLNERKQVTAREDAKSNIVVVGVIEKPAGNLNEMMSIIQSAMKSRTVGVTGANSDSSRSHAVIVINLYDMNNGNKPHGKITFVDLAGSEREADKVDVGKQTRIDGAEINKSLLALKECIRAMEMEKKHTPFRGSKLTMVLRDSFIGNNCKTLMIANVAPSSSNADHTLNTLRYADRVKEIKSKSSSNNVSRQTMINNKENGINSTFKSHFKKDPSLIIGQILSNASNNINNIQTIPEKTQSLSQNSVETFETNNIENNFIPLSQNVPVNFGIEDNTNNNQNFNIGNNFGNGSPMNNGVGIIKQKISIKPKKVPIKQEHEKILSEILISSDQCLSDHKVHANHMVELLQQEMNLIEEMQKPNCNIANYVTTAKHILSTEYQRIKEMEMKFEALEQLLIKEEQLSNQIKATEFHNGGQEMNFIDNSIEDTDMLYCN